MQVIPFSRLMLSQGSKITNVTTILRLVCTPAMQLPILNSMNNLSLHSANKQHRSTRYLSHNPFNGAHEQEKEQEKELQRKLTQHGLKAEYADFSTTLMERAKLRLQSSSSERRRKRELDSFNRKNHID